MTEESWMFGGQGFESRDHAYQILSYTLKAVVRLK